MTAAFGKLRVSAGALVFAGAVFFIDAPLLVCILVSAAAHEAGHMTALRLFRARVSDIRIEPWGFEMSYTGALSYGKEIVTAAAGPAASFLFAVLLSAAGRLFVLQELYIASGVSFIFGLFNALPVLPLDGGRILHNALALALGPFAAERGMCISSCAVVFALLVSGAALFIETWTNFTLLLAAVWLFISYCKRSGVRLKLDKSNVAWK